MDKFKVTVDANGKVEIWIDGCLITGVRAINFQWDIDSFPTYQIDFLAQVAKIDRKYSKD